MHAVLIIVPSSRCHFRDVIMSGY